MQVRPASGNLDAFFAPKLIAVVGVSPDVSTLNGRTLALLRATYRGRVVPVHPTRDEVQGLPAVPSLADIAPVPDLVIVSVRTEAALEVARQAADLGVKALVVFSSGFAEIGSTGAELQRQLADLARRSGMRVFGPNCLGLMSVPSGTLATFADIPEPTQFRAGGTALASQSGAVGSMLFTEVQRLRVGASYFAATGNEVDVSLTEVLEYFVELPDVHTVLAFAEQISDPQRFLRLARRASELAKPLVVMKVGSSQAGARAALSHTGSMVGTDDVIEAVFRQYGVVRAHTARDLLGYAQIFEQRRRARGRRVGIVSISGGVGVHLADTAEAAGLVVPDFVGPDRERVAATIPAFGSAANPVDCTAQVGVNDRSALRQVLQTVADLDAVDMICYGGLPGVPDEPLLSALDALRDRTDKPAVVWCSAAESQAAVRRRGIPCFTDADTAMNALAAVADFSSAAAVPEDLPPAGHGAPGRRTRTMTEAEARDLLGGYGVPVPSQFVVTSPDDAAAAAARIGGPVALKIVSEELPHKSDVGGVLLDVRTPAEAAEGYTRVLATVHANAPGAGVAGVLVQEMAPAGLELMLGVHVDSQWGPVVTIGIGGITTEIIGRTASLLAPFEPGEAVEAIRRIADGRLVTHSRGLPVPRIPEVAELAHALGRLALEHPDIVEIDLNPVIVTEDRLAAIDALVVVHER